MWGGFGLGEGFKALVFGEVGGFGLFIIDFREGRIQDAIDIALIGREGQFALDAGVGGDGDFIAAAGGRDGFGDLIWIRKTRVINDFGGVGDELAVWGVKVDIAVVEIVVGGEQGLAEVGEAGRVIVPISIEVDAIALHGDFGEDGEGFFDEGYGWDDDGASFLPDDLERRTGAAIVIFQAATRGGIPVFDEG